MPAAGETNVDPDVVVPAAARLAVQAAQLRRVLAGHHQALQGLHGCWSDDEAGRAFEKAYYGEGGTATSNAADNIAEGCQNVCESIEALSENAGISALYAQNEDETSHDDLIAAYQEQYQEFLQASEEAAEGTDSGASPDVEWSDEDAGQPATQFVGQATQRLSGPELRHRLLSGDAVGRWRGPEFRAQAVSRTAGPPPLYRTVTDRDREYYGLGEVRDGRELWALGASGSELAARRELAAQLEAGIVAEREPAPWSAETIEETHSPESSADGLADGVEARFGHRAMERSEPADATVEPAGGVEARFGHRVVERPEPAEATAVDQEPVTGQPDADAPSEPEVYGDAEGDPPAEPRPAWELHPPLRRMMARRVTPDSGGEAAGPS